MNLQHRTWYVVGIVGLTVVTIACGLPTPTPEAARPTATSQTVVLATLTSPVGTATLTPGPQTDNNTGTGAAKGGTSGNSAGNGGNGSGNGGNGSNSGNGNAVESSTPTPTLLPEPFSGPYVVKQIETLGGEVISGGACSLTKPFVVSSVTPHASFAFQFVPQDSQKGKVTYTYSIPSAGESHVAAGTYTLSPVGNDGTFQLALSVSDHVVFKGFDGNIPLKYKFNLVPSGDTPCPPAP